MSTTDFLTDFEIDGTILTGYSGEGGDVIIPEGVKEIAAKAFYGNSKITSVSFPDSLEVIGEAAFTGCPRLEKISWAEGLRIIENHAFASCGRLASLSLPEGLLRIEQSAFSPCGALEEVIFPSTLEYIGEFAFSCCRALTKVELPDGLPVIDRSAFSMCSRLPAVSLPRALKAIPRGVFLGCSLLKSINISVNVSSVENNAFSGCRKLMNINVDPANPFIKDVDGVLYSHDGKRLMYFPGGRLEIIIPEGVTEIGCEAFYENLNFDRITLPSTLVSIADRAFYGCSELLKISFPETLKSLGQSAFERCSKLKNLYLPDGFERIGDSALRSCKALMWLRLPEGFAFDLHWFSAPNDPPCYSADHTIIPFVSTRSFSDITSDIGTRRAALGMIMAETEGVKADPYLTAAYTDYIRANISAYYEDMLADDSILKWLLDHRLVPEGDTERLLERASDLGRATASALLLDYKSNNRPAAVSAAPKLNLDEHFDALENALDF